MCWQVEIDGIEFSLQRPSPLWEDDFPPDRLVGEHGICRIAYSQLRTEPSDAAEQEAQLTFGEVYTVKALSENRRWIQVERAYDGSIGWFDEHRHRYAAIPQKDFEVLRKTHHGFVGSKNFELIDERGRILSLPLGGVLPFYDEVKRECRVADTCYQVHQGEVLVGIQSPSQEILLSLLQKYVGVVYEWGGETSYGADCSGLVRTMYRMFGVEMPRNSGPQSEVGERIELHECKTGDLLFFGTKGKERVHHVGIAVRDDLGEKLYLFHAGPGELQLVPVEEDGYYPHSDLTREFRFAKRVVEFQ